MKNETEPDSKELTPLQRSQLRHQKVRIIRQDPEVLSDLPIELFLRLVGLFYTVPEALRESEKFRDASHKFEELRLFIDTQLSNGDGKNFAKYEMGDYVHNLYLLLIGVMQIDFLEANIDNARADYHGHVDETTYKAYTSNYVHQYLVRYCSPDPAKPDFRANKDEYEEKLRIEYRTLINEIRRAKLFEEHIEATRSFLVKSVSRMYLWIVLIPLIVLSLYGLFIWYLDYNGNNHTLTAYTDIYNNYLIATKGPAYVIAKKYSDTWFNGIIGIVLLCLSAISGATGSLVSVLLRIQGVRDNSQLAQNIVAFKYSVNSVKIAPVTGLIFAIALSLMFSGNLIAGTLFPAVGKTWTNVLFQDQEVAKWIIWCFVAGFSERLVPDMIDKLSDKAKQADRK